MFKEEQTNLGICRTAEAAFTLLFLFIFKVPDSYSESFIKLELEASIQAAVTPVITINY
jgi:hypothetical protein